MSPVDLSPFDCYSEVSATPLRMRVCVCVRMRACVCMRVGGSSPQALTASPNLRGPTSARILPSAQFVSSEPPQNECPTPLSVSRMRSGHVAVSVSTESITMGPSMHGGSDVGVGP